MAFQTMPYLFEQWGSTLAVVAGVCWFDYCFAGITSSLAMGTPWMGFMRDEFGWSKNKELGLWSNDFSFRFTKLFFLRKECLMNMIIGRNGKFSCFAMFETILFLDFEWTKDGVKSQVVLISKSQIFINLSLNI
jgi:SNF family Na+-dependent transporter